MLGGGLKRNLVGWERRRIQRWEDQSFRSLGLLVVHSLKDKRYVESRFSPRREPSVINPWIHRTSLVQDATGLRKIPNTLLFWGAMDRQENIDAAIWIAKEIHPLIRRKVPNAIFYIAGNRSEKLKAQLAGCKGVILTGFVDDISALMRSMEIAMLPLRLGAGIKIKTLECMDAGIPVITTEVGAEGIDGIDGREFVIGATARDLAEAGVELLLDKERARAIGVAGQRIICQRYNFEGKLKELESRLYEIASS
ncbi:MAG TPA: glycosyltransferase family 4 protein [Bryobacteraceae bacterium]